MIDGADGSGKATQTGLLVEALRKMGRDVRTLDFPQYEDNFFGGFVGERLRGEHGDFLAVDPQIASVIYAADRFESAVKLRKWLDEGATVVLDRYVSANQIHQGGKIVDTKKRGKFLLWLDKMEYEVFKIPRPDKIIYLDVPVVVSQELLRKSGKKLDDAEQNLQYLENSRKSALWLARREDNWHRIICAKQGKLRSIDSIHEEVFACAK